MSHDDRTGAAGPQDRPGAEAGQRRRDAGRTSGGGSLGHKQPEDVAKQTNIRNEPSDQRPDSPPSDDSPR